MAVRREAAGVVAVGSLVLIIALITMYSRSHRNASLAPRKSPDGLNSQQTANCAKSYSRTYYFYEVFQIEQFSLDKPNWISYISLERVKVSGFRRKQIRRGTMRIRLMPLALCLAMLLAGVAWGQQPTIPRVGRVYGNDVYGMGGGGVYEFVVTGNVSEETQFACSYFANPAFVNDYFNDNWSGMVLKATNITSGVSFTIEDFVSSNGTFTTSSVGANWDVGDRVIIWVPATNGEATHFTVTATCSTGNWDEVAFNRIVTVGTQCRVRILAQVLSPCLGAAGSATIALGTTAATTSLIGATLGSSLDTDEFWCSSDSLYNIKIAYPSTYIELVTADNIGYTIGTEAFTNGQIIFDVWWEPEPINTGGTASAGAGESN